MPAEPAPVHVESSLQPLDITGLHLATQVATYNPGGYTYLPEPRTGGYEIDFWLTDHMFGGYWARAKFGIMGSFDTYGEEKEHPILANCYLYCLENKDLSDEVMLKITGTPSPQAAGTHDDPRIRFHCAFEIELFFDKWLENVDPTDCHGWVLVKVNRYGAMSYVSHAITYGDAKVTANPGEGFWLEHESDRSTHGTLVQGL
jgi:hypothetical protein